MQWGNRVKHVGATGTVGSRPYHARKSVDSNSDDPKYSKAEAELDRRQKLISLLSTTIPLSLSLSCFYALASPTNCSVPFHARFIDPRTIPSPTTQLLVSSYSDAQRCYRKFYWRHPLFYFIIYECIFMQYLLSWFLTMTARRNLVKYS